MWHADINFSRNIFSSLHVRTELIIDDFKKIESIQKFKKTLLKFIRTKENSVLRVSDFMV